MLGREDFDFRGFVTTFQILASELSVFRRMVGFETSKGGNIFYSRRKIIKKIFLSRWAIKLRRKDSILLGLEGITRCSKCATFLPYFFGSLRRNHVHGTHLLDFSRKRALDFFPRRFASIFYFDNLFNNFLLLTRCGKRKTTIFALCISKGKRIT